MIDTRTRFARREGFFGSLLLLFAVYVVLPTGCSPRIDGTLAGTSPGQVQVGANNTGLGPAPTALPTSDAGIGEWLDPRIKSIIFGNAGQALLDPIVPLEGGSVQLTFDWLSSDATDFRYSITHCDRDWKPSRLSTLDYLVSFTEGDIRDYRLSVTTALPYTSYQLQLPNQYVAWKVSGNYLLNIFDDDGGKLVARLRFCVFEGQLNPDPVFTRPTNALLDRTHQEFDVTAFTREARIEEPRRSLTLSVIQNGDWRYGIYNLPPRLMRGEDAVWDYPGQLAFAGHREWRTLDLRTLLSSGGQIDEVTRDKGGYTAFLKSDLPRRSDADEIRVDVNGKFALGDFDNRREGRADYANVIFSLKTPRDPALEPVYLYGGYNGFALGEGNQGVYNELTKSYIFRALIRQGFYDFAYVTPSTDGLGPNWTSYEGNTFAAENYYHFLLYYRPYGARYDRLIGHRFFPVDP